MLMILVYKWQILLLFLDTLVLPCNLLKEKNLIIIVVMMSMSKPLKNMNRILVWKRLETTFSKNWKMAILKLLSLLIKSHAVFWKISLKHVGTWESIMIA